MGGRQMTRGSVRRWTILTAMALATASFGVLASSAEAACTSQADVQTTGDACGTILSVSVWGDSHGEKCQDRVSCISVSVWGDSSNNGHSQSANPSGHGVQEKYSCGAGHLVANGADGLTPSPTTGVAAGCIAVSVFGNASNESHQYTYQDKPECNGVECGAGQTPDDARYSCGFANTGVGVGCIAVSGKGTASNHSGSDSCGSATPGSVGIGCIAVGGQGASNTATGERSCGFSGVGAGVGCIAVSQGSASNSGADLSCGAAYTAGVGVGCVAVGGDSASNTTGEEGCGMGVLAVAAGCAAVGGNSASNSSGKQGCGYSVGGLGAGCAAASGGTADNSGAKDTCGISTLGAAAGCVAAGRGGASNSGGANSCGTYERQGGAAAGCVAGSTDGPASNASDGEVCDDSHVTPVASPDPENPDAGLLVGCVASGQ